MKLLMLRGQVPTDRGKDGWKEITYPNLGQCDDIYTLMAHELTKDTKNDWCEVVYWGRERHQMVAANMWEVWKKDLDAYRPAMEPDVIWARGGFPEYEPVLKRYPKAFKIYYGAGKRFVPKGFINYDLVLVDSEDQKAIVEKKLPGVACQLWFKPAPPMFKPMTAEKKYDVCFVAVHPDDSRKRAQWVYDTVPRDIKVLQLGNKTMAAPPNVRVTRAPRSYVACLMNQCRVGIVPYTKDDSAPRVMSEFFACRIPVVVSKSVRHPWSIEGYCDDLFWSMVKHATAYPRPLDDFDVTVACCSNYIQYLIDKKGRIP